jgi:hypothetical protein
MRDPPNKDKGTWAICSSDAQHDHSQPIKVKKTGLDPAIHKLVCQYEKGGIPPKRMLTMIRAAGHEPPAISKINQALKTIRKSKRETATGSKGTQWSMRNILNYVEKNSVKNEEIATLDKDKLFVYLHSSTNYNQP